MSSLLPAAAAAVPLASGWSVHSLFLRRRLTAAGRDPLSGLLRREAFETAAARLLRKQPVAVAVIDLDGFKQINDHHGHAAGDAVIRAAGAALFEAVDGRGVAARLGGDEFAAVVPMRDPFALPGLLSGLHGCLTAPLAHEGRTLRVGASVGGVHAPAGADVAAALRRADESMYAAKAVGGGWWIAPPGKPPAGTVNGRRAGRKGTAGGTEGGAG